MIETDRINRLGEYNEINIGKVEAGILGYVDDILGTDILYWEVKKQKL